MLLLKNMPFKIRVFHTCASLAILVPLFLHCLIHLNHKLSPLGTMSSQFTEANRMVFEKMSHTYKANFENGIKTLVKAVQDQRGWASDTWIDTEAGKGKEIRMLEYACGPGHISMALAPFVTSITGMDVSDGMIDEFNKNAEEAGLSNTVVGFKADLLAQSEPAEISGPAFFDFDIVVVSMALHHFEEPELALSRLSRRLKKGGVLIIIDLVPETHVPQHEFGHEVAQTIKKHGFSLEDMQKLYGDAGIATGFKYQVIDEPFVFKKDEKTFSKTIFMARGQRGV